MSLIVPGGNRNALLLVTVVPTFTNRFTCPSVAQIYARSRVFRFNRERKRVLRTTYRENSNCRGTESPGKVILEITLAACNYTLLGRVYGRLCAGMHSRFLQRACHPFPWHSGNFTTRILFIRVPATNGRLQKPWSIKERGIIIVSWMLPLCASIFPPFIPFLPGPFRFLFVLEARQE